jgi:CheY-like chemotaxis protein
MSSVMERLPETSCSPNPSQESDHVFLVVDDSLVDRRMLTALLQNHFPGRVLTASNGLEALKVLRHEQPALVLTDMQMPEMNGLELVESVRADYPTLPIILMTGNGSEELALRALKSGAASYVAKRELCTLLVETVESVLAAGRQERRRSKILECVKRIECEFQLENDPALVPHLVAHLQEQLVRMKACNENGRIRIGVAIEEALLNGIYHGNLELSSDLRQDGSNRFNELAEERRQISPYRDRRLYVQVQLSPQTASFVIRDEGPGFDVKGLPDPTDPENMLKASGRGLLLIRTFMDEVFHNPAGNQITMIKRI